MVRRRAINALECFSGGTDMFLPPAPNTCRSTTARPRRHSKTSYSTCSVVSGLLQQHCAGRLRGSTTSCACWFTSRFWDTRRYLLTSMVANIPGRSTLRASSCGHGVSDTSTNWRQSLFCCRTASMEQAADGAETAAIDELKLQSEIDNNWCLNIINSAVASARLYVSRIQLHAVQAADQIGER